MDNNINLSIPSTELRQVQPKAESSTLSDPSIPLVFNGVTIPDEIEKKYFHFRPGWWMVMVHLLAGKRQVDIASTLGISPGTVSRLWCEKEFRSAYVEMNSQRNKKAIENFSLVKDNLDTSSVRAEEILAELMDDETVTPSVRHSSAKTILEMAGHKAKERISLETDKPIDITMNSPGYKKEDDPFEQYSKKEDEEEKETNNVIEEDFAFLDKLAVGGGGR